MAQKRRFSDQFLESLVGKSQSSDEEEEVGFSAPDTFSSSSEEFYLEGKDKHEDRSEDEDKDLPVSDGQSQLAPPPSSASSESEAEGTAAHGDHSGRRRGHTTAVSFVSPAALHANEWQTEKQADALPEPLPRFFHTRAPGVIGFGVMDNPSPSDLFKAFFDKKTVSIICDNTNKQADKNIKKGKKFKWSDIGPTEFYKFVGLLFYMSVLKLPEVAQDWEKDSFFSVMSPAFVMARTTFQAISLNLHMSDPEKDAQNDEKKGTPNYDPLHRLKPLYDHIKNACRAFYHPRQNIVVDERIKKREMLQYTKIKPTKYGIKFFVLVDASNGYTIAFKVYTGRSHLDTGEGLSFDSVMTLIDKMSLGRGYHLYCDDFYTSPKLFKELLSLKVHACGTYRDNRRQTPSSKVNAITKKSNRGTIRWIRDGPLLFTKWMDRREVSVCSTIHTAYTGETVQRRVKCDGQWQTQSIPTPTPVVEYNKHMSGVDLPEQMIQFYSVRQRTTQWYKIIFQHFLDIAATNAYIIHKELCQMKQQEPLTHLKFMETLAAELCGCCLDGTPTSTPATPDTPSTPATPDTPSTPATPDTQPKPATPPTSAPSSPPASPVVAPTPDPPITEGLFCMPHAANSNPENIGSKASKGRLRCKLCNKKTAWKCRNCDVPLCLIVDRNCFADYHDAAPI